MNEKEMFNAINKGIPNQVKLELPVKDLIEYCSFDKNELLKAMQEVRRNYENGISSITGYIKSKHEFFNNLRLITNYKDSSTNIYVSPMCFYHRLKEILGVKNESYDLDNEELLSEFNKRLKLLSAISDIDDLKEEFSIIFEDYKYSLNFTDEIREKEKNNPGSADTLRANYQKYGLDSRFKVFLSNQKTMYYSLVENIKKVMDYADTSPISLEKFKGLDKDKFELYVANKYLEYAIAKEDDKYKQLAIYYLTTYLNESCGKVIKMKYRDGELSNISLLKDFRKFLKNNRELKPVNESRKVFNSYHIKHVKNHINKYLNSLKDWCLVKVEPNELLMNQQARIEQLAIYNMNNKEENRDKKHLTNEKYLATLMRKLDFYENSNYELRLFGTGPFESHVAYFYPNGMVVVDKLYRESLEIDPTYNEAIYVMDVNTFLNMMSMDKPNLRENENVKRIFHSGAWEERLMKEINNPTINLNKDDFKELNNKYLSK